MIDELRPYDKYRSTGVPWIGEVPDHWGMERAKWLYQKMARPVRDADEIVTCFRDGIVTLRKNRRLGGFTNALKEIGYQGVRRGDLVIHAMDAFAGAVGVSDSDGKSTPVYSVCTARTELDNRYYAYLVREMARSQWIVCLARGIRERSTDFRFQAFGAQPVPLPPVEEQRAVADYLDANAAKVRRFIRNRRRLIEVLNEQRRSIIRALATRGTRAEVEMRDTALDQFPVLPAHWEESRVKREFTNLDHKRIPLSTTVRGEMATREYDYYGASGVIDQVEDYIFDDELLLIAEDGANLVLRNLPLAIIARGKFWVNNHAHILKPKRGNIEYFAHVVELVDYRPWVTGAAQPKLTRDRLMRVGIPAPPVEEQGEIVTAINNETGTLIEGIAKAKREIELIRECRSRLIADVVTGKIDVRHLAPPPDSEDLQEAIDELEPLDDAAGELDEDALAGEATHAD